MSLPLLDGQGNFGSMDGDKPAAMRYTEVRMAKPAGFLLADIDKETVDFQPNYDGKDLEPTVLPARFPNMLVNGAGGIAVGMATNIPPHNLGEVIDATLALIENPELTVADLMEFVPAPDFPTGALILGRSGARKAYHEGRGSVIIRARTRIEEVRGGRTAIIVSEIPYQVNKATMIERIAELARDRKIEGIAHVQDESDRFGVRVVVELRRDATPDVVLNQLFRFTPLQTSFGCNMLALNGGRPEVLDLKRFLTAFIAFREEVVARRTAFELRKARERAHVLCGLAVAVANVDEVVATIRASADPAEARERLMTRAWPAAEIAPYISLIDDPSHRVQRGRHLFPLRDPGPRHPRAAPAAADRARGQGGDRRARDAGGGDHRLSRHPALARADHGDHRGRAARGEGALRRAAPVRGDRLGRRPRRRGPDRARGHGGHRHRRRLHQAHAALTEYRSQRRGGKGTQGMATKDEDFVTRLFVANTHTALLVFTTEGMVYSLEDLAAAARRAQRPRQGDRQHPADPDRRLGGGALAGRRAGGGVGEPADRLRHLGRRRAAQRARRLHQRQVERQDRHEAPRGDAADQRLHRLRGRRRDADHPGRPRHPLPGQRRARLQGPRLRPACAASASAAGDAVVSMAVIRHFEATPEERAAYLKMRRAVAGAPEEEADVEEGEEEAASDSFVLGQARYVEMSEAEDLLLTVTANGAGKLSSSHDYPVRGRGGQGVAAMDRAMRGGPLVALFAVASDDQVMLATDAGQSIRVPVSDISFRSRSAGGVRVFTTAADEHVVSVALIAENGETEEE